MSSPKPGMAPMKVPSAPDRSTVRQYRVTSRMRGMTESILDETAFTAGPRMADSTSATPNTPTSTGSRPSPPARSGSP